jgi:hypothetical protein
MKVSMLSWENAVRDDAGGRRLGEWLRRQRQARARNRAEMARQLIKAAGAGVTGLWREMTITRNAGGGNGIAGKEAGNR